MAGVTVEAAAGEILRHTEVQVFEGFSSLQVCSGVCVVFLKVELLNSFGVLVGPLPSLSPWGKLGALLRAAACCFAALLLVAIGSISVLPWVMD